MDIRDRVFEAMKARADGRVVQGRYYPPGSMVQRAADMIATFGTLGLFFPLAAFNTGYEYPLLYPGIDTGWNFGIWTVGTFVGGVYVILTWMSDDWRTRLGTALVGLVGLIITGEYALQFVFWALFEGVPFPPTQVVWVSLGNVFIFFGGVVSTAAALFGEWAKKYDTG